MNRTERAVRGSAASLLQVAARLLLYALLTPVILHYGGQEVLGAYAVLIQVIGYLVLLDLGLSNALSRFLPQAHGGDDGGRRFGAILTTGRTVFLGVGAVSSLVLVILAFTLDRFLELGPSVESDARAALLLLAVWVPVRMWFAIYPQGLVAVQDLAFGHLLNAAGNTLGLLVSLALVMGGQGLVGLMVGTIAYEMLVSLASWQRFVRRQPVRPSGLGIPDRELMRDMLAFGLQVFVIGLAVRLILYTDNIVVGLLHGSVAVSVYYTTFTPASLGWNLIFRITDNAIPGLHELFGSRQTERFRAAFLRLYRYTLHMATLLAAGVVIFNRGLVELWVGPEQFAGELMTWSLAAFTIAICLGHTGGTVVYASGRMGLMPVMALGEGAANLALSLLLGTSIGLEGVMLASVLASVVPSLYLLARILGELEMSVLRFARCAVLPGILPLAVTVPAMVVAARLVGTGSLASLAGCVGASVAVHALAVWFLGLSAEERATFASQLPFLRRPGS